MGGALHLAELEGPHRGPESSFAGCAASDLAARVTSVGSVFARPPRPPAGTGPPERPHMHRPGCAAGLLRRRAQRPHPAHAQARRRPAQGDSLR